MYHFTELKPAADYAVRIKVRNLVHESVWTDKITARTGIVPARPGLLTFDSTTRTTVSLSFAALIGDDTGGTDAAPLEITAYHIYIDNGQGGSFSSLVTLPGAETSYTVPFLVPNLVYRFTY